MIYLHEKPYGDNFIRHWANETKSATDDIATYKIRQIETNIIYYEAIDTTPCKYTYEATDEPIEKDEPIEYEVIDE